MKRLVAVSSLLLLAAGVRAQDHAEHTHTTAPVAQGESTHVPPDPPAHPMRDMSAREMLELMDMDDAAALLMIKADALEWRGGDDDELSWDASAWYGNDYDKLILESEGDRANGDTDARIELGWDRVIHRWWTARAAIRYDVHPGPSRTWAAFGIHGLAPYWFEVDVTAYVGAGGRTALRASVDYDLLLSQRWVLQPEFEIEAYGKNDEPNLIGAGIAETELAVRLRYEIKRELAPYIGVAWTNKHGKTADFARLTHGQTSELQWLAGVRCWF